MNKLLDQQLFNNFNWVLLGIVMVIPFIAWSTIMHIKFGDLTILTVFPLLGLWAWSIMWTHYILGTLRIIYGYKKNAAYSRISGALVVLLILLHPALLAWSQWSSSGSLPPSSFYSYVAPTMKFAILMGSTALLIFLSFEFFERFKEKKVIINNWKWISLSQMLAMTLIFIHSMVLGGTMQSSWFQYYWVMLGALLIPCFGIIGRNDWMSKQSNHAKQNLGD